MKGKQLEIDVLAETNRLLQAKIKEMNSEISKRDKRHKKEKEDHTKLQSEVKILKTRITTYEEKIVTLQTEIVEKEKELGSARVNTDDNTLTTLTNLMATKFKEVEKNLKESILAEVSKNNKRMEDKINEVVIAHKSYADTVKNTEEGWTTVPPNNFHAMIREERNEQLAEETDKKLRSCNIVLHGLAELITDNKLDAKKHDDTLIDVFITDLGLEVNYKSTTRLGKRNEDAEQRKRPIKVTMDSEQDKDRIMAGHIEIYKGVSVTDDHTLKGRNTIKEWVDKAKTANATVPHDSSYEWKVGGSPKNGMSLKKFKKQTAGD